MPETQSPAPSPEPLDRIVVRSWPKIIFLYPTFVIAIICGVWQWFVVRGDNTWSSDGSLAAACATIGRIFFFVFAVNLLVISFEFSRLKTVAMAFGIMALVFFLLFLSTRYEVFQTIRNLFGGFDLKMSISFYFAIAAYFLVVYLFVFINTRWNYWVVRHNEIIHYSGFLGDIRRFPSPNLRMTKTIDDVFEFLLLGSGKITLYPASEREAIVLDNVLGVNRKEVAIKGLLSALQVKVSPGVTHESMEREEEE
jgi:hypothetical protein